MSQSAPAPVAAVEKRRKLFYGLAAVCVFVVIGIGVFARGGGWPLPATDPLSGKKTGWFGAKSEPKAAATRLGPSLPAGTPLPLAKEYIYAGSRLLAVEDAGANAAPPADLAVWRPSDGTWYVLGGTQGSQQTYFTWGQAGDIPVQGDYDGDGKTDFSVFRPSQSTWYIVYSSSGQTVSIAFGTAGDTPAPADYDGDGKTDAAVYRRNDPSGGLATWYIRKSSDSSLYGMQFGLASDVPAAADYDGDGRADIGVYRDSNTTFYSFNSSNGAAAGAAFGAAGSVPVSADYDGDGRADYALKAGSSWTIRQSSNAQIINVAWQAAGDVAVQNDYDADGRVDIAVWRPANGTWYIRQSSLLGQSGELRQVQWGMNGDTPVPALYRR